MVTLKGHLNARVILMLLCIIRTLKSKEKESIVYVNWVKILNMKYKIVFIEDRLFGQRLFFLCVFDNEIGNIILLEITL